MSPFEESMSALPRCLSRYRTALLTLILLLLLPGHAEANWPMGYLSASGARAYPIKNLTWGVLLISLAVIAITIILLLGGLIRGWWSHSAPAPDGRQMVGPSPGGLSWIAIGVGFTTVTLFAVSIWTVVTLASVSKMHGDLPGAKPADFELEVIGHQWWWEVKYNSETVSRRFTTANEIHIPVGRPVRVKLRGVDVIHSFWIPALGGKTDVIPGQINETWLEASQPGRYRGQCTEFCGNQHAKMALFVIADPPERFSKWWDNQLKGVPAAISEAESAGQTTFVRNCGVCHTLRGTSAHGVLGPDLSHLMTRGTIAAGVLPNDPGHLSAWISDPQSFKSGTLMPRLDISGSDLNRIRNFLEHLN